MALCDNLIRMEGSPYGQYRPPDFLGSFHSQQQACLRELAINRSDISLCNEINISDNYILGYSCGGSIAKKEKDGAVCGMMKSNVSQIGCIISYSTENGDLNSCFKLDKYWKTICISGIILGAKGDVVNQSICNELPLSDTMNNYSAPYPGAISKEYCMRNYVESQK
jgi:hypothetical protein